VAPTTTTFIFYSLSDTSSAVGIFAFGRAVLCHLWCSDFGALRQNPSTEELKVGQKSENFLDGSVDPNTQFKSFPETLSLFLRLLPILQQANS